MADDERLIQFKPTRAEGMSDVLEVKVFPKRLEVLSQGSWRIIHFRPIARRQMPFWKALFRKLRGKWAPNPFVGGRDFDHLVFHTSPKLVLYLPAEDRDLPFTETLRWRISCVIARGGYCLLDMT